MHKPAVLALAAAVTLAGCADFGTGGTGELVIPDGELRRVDTLELPVADEAADAEQPPAAQSLDLTIEQARAAALANNFGLQVDLLSPTASRQGITAERAAFEALFTTNASFLTSDQPTATELEGSQFENLQITPGVVVPLYTGGTVTVQLPLSRTETDNVFSTLNPSYTSDAVVSLSQPLLRGAGVDANARGIRLAFYAYQQSLSRTKLAVIRLLADVDRAYWRLFAFRELLGVRIAELELSREQVERARRRVRAGEVAEVEVLRAQAAVADAAESIIIAENDVRAAGRLLKRLMNAPELAVGGATALVPTTDPAALLYDADDDRLAARAVADRMELVEAELQIAAEVASLKFAENQLLPAVTLDYQYTANGLGGSFDDSFNQLGEVDFEDHRVGLNVQVPLGNRAARARYRQALVGKVQALFSYEDRRLLIEQEVYDAADTLRSAWQRIVAARRRVDLEARLYEAEVRQFENNLRTSTEVNEAQNRLAAARASEIQAVTTYQIARVDLAVATGSVLGAAAVTWEPSPVPPDRANPLGTIVGK